MNAELLTDHALVIQLIVHVRDFGADHTTVTMFAEEVLRRMGPLEPKTRLHTLGMLTQRFRRYGLSATWFKAEALAGRIPHFVVGRRIFFDPEAVECALLERAADIHPAAVNTGA